MAERFFRRWLDKLSGEGKYDLFSILILTIFSILFFRIRRYLPVISDSWYHLSVIRAFAEKGFSLHAWWEFAPFGRPHLYSPLFHIINVFILKTTNLGLLDLAKLWGTVTFPCILASGWLAARFLFGRKAALFTLLLVSLNINLFFSFVIMPGTYAVCLWPFVHILIIRKRCIFAAMLLSIIFYLHFGIAVLIALSLLVFSAFKKEYLKHILLILAGNILICSPWLIHLYLNRNFIHPGKQVFSFYIPLLAIIGLACGIFFAVRNRSKESLAVISIILASGVLLFNLPDRFSTYAGLLFPLLAGYGIDCLGKKQRRVIAVILVVSCISFTPFVRHAKPIALPMRFKGIPLFEPTPLLTLICCQNPDIAGRFRYSTIPDNVVVMTALIKKHVEEDKIILTSNSALGSAIFVLTGRRTTTGMWPQIMTEELRKKVGAYYSSGEGYSIVNSDRIEEVMSLGNLDFVATEGDAAIFHRGPSR